MLRVFIRHSLFRLIGGTTVYAHPAASVLPWKRLGYEAVKKGFGSPAYGRSTAGPDGIKRLDLKIKRESSFKTWCR